MRAGCTKAVERRGGIERVCQLLIASLEQLEHRQIALMAGLAGVGGELADFSKHALAEPLQCGDTKFAEDLPIDSPI